MFSGRIEAFLTSTKRAQIISDLLLWEIIPQFVIPPSLQSDNGIKFTFQFSQTLSKVLNIPWYFHVPYHTQSLWKTERTNCSSKIILVKMLQELFLASDSFQALNSFQIILFNFTLWSHIWAAVSNSLSPIWILTSPWSPTHPITLSPPFPPMKLYWLLPTLTPVHFQSTRGSKSFSLLQTNPSHSFTLKDRVHLR